MGDQTKVIVRVKAGDDVADMLGTARGFCLDLATSHEALGQMVDQIHTALDKAKTPANLCANFALLAQLEGAKERAPGASCLSDKDKEDLLQFCVPFGVNFAIVPVATGDDVEEVRAFLGRRGRHVKVLARLVGGALDKAGDVLALADGVVLKGCGPATASLVKLAHACNKLALIADDEAAACVAVKAGVDGVIVEALPLAGSFKQDIEAAEKEGADVAFDSDAAPEAVCREAVAEAGSGLLIALTESGWTARALAKYRPSGRVLAVSATESAVKSIVLVRGVTTMQVASFQGTEHVLKAVMEQALGQGLVAKGAKVVCVQGVKEEMPGHECVATSWVAGEDRAPA